MNDKDLTNNAFKNIFIHSPIAIVQYDTNGILKDCNLSCLNLFGINEINEVKGYNLFEDPNLNAEQKNEIKAGNNIRYQLEYNFDIIKELTSYQTSKSGIYYLDCSITSFKTEDNKITDYLLYILDITVQKKAEQALKEKETQLIELNATKDKFFSIIAHDLKNPIAQMIQLSNLIGKKYSDLSEEMILSFVKAMNESSNRGLKLLENLLEWARSQTGAIIYNPEPILVFRIIEEIIDLLYYSAEKKNIQIINNVDKQVEILADRNMINTVLRNIISNAIKFTFPKGKVEISTRIQQDPIEIICKDNGIGLTKEESQKVFKIDSVFSMKGTENENGTGLGLILCKEFIDKHGGKIWVESEKGKGSEFKFTMPLNKPE